MPLEKKKEAFIYVFLTYNSICDYADAAAEIAGQRIRLSVTLRTVRLPLMDR
jgi:hypothetical protein